MFIYNKQNKIKKEGRHGQIKQHVAGAADGAREEHENDMVVDLVLVGLVMHSYLVRGVKKPKKGLIKGSWTSKGTSCNPNLPLQCSGA